MISTSSSLFRSIPSPSINGIPIDFMVPGTNIHLDFTIRFYALCILLGIVVALTLTSLRWTKRGAPKGATLDVALWAIVFGFIGARLYHVITDWEQYFGPGKDPMKVFAVSEGGLGIWGSVVLGALGAWIGCYRKGLKFSSLADAAAPGLLLAQAIGRWGNYFNQELYGQPTNLPWGLEINTVPIEYTSKTTFHPTFLYESLWCLAGAILLLVLDSKFKFTHGRLFLIYIMYYTLGRFWIENLRIDDAKVPEIFGISARLNMWVSILCFIGALIWFIILTVKYGSEKANSTTALKNPVATEEQEAQKQEKKKVSQEEKVLALEYLQSQSLERKRGFIPRKKKRFADDESDEPVDFTDLETLTMENSQKPTSEDETAFDQDRGDTVAEEKLSPQATESKKRSHRASHSKRAVSEDSPNKSEIRSQQSSQASIEEEEVEILKKNPQEKDYDDDLEKSERKKLRRSALNLGNTTADERPDAQYYVFSSESEQNQSAVREIDGRTVSQSQEMRLKLPRRAVVVDTSELDEVPEKISPDTVVQDSEEYAFEDKAINSNKTKKLEESQAEKKEDQHGRRRKKS